MRTELIVLMRPEVTLTKLDVHRLRQRARTGLILVLSWNKMTARTVLPCWMESSYHHPICHLQNSYTTHMKRVLLLICASVYCLLPVVSCWADTDSLFSLSILTRTHWRLAMSMGFFIALQGLIALTSIHSIPFVFTITLSREKSWSLIRPMWARSKHVCTIMATIADPLMGFSPTESLKRSRGCKKLRPAGHRHPDGWSA